MKTDLCHPMLYSLFYIIHVLIATSVGSMNDELYFLNAV